MITKQKLTPKQKKLFNDNFNRQVYDLAKNAIQKAVSESRSFGSLWGKLHKYDCDVEYEDDFTIISCEVELDRSQMKTKGDYVGLCFYIKWYDETNSGIIDTVALYSSEPSGEYEADLLCYIDPNTCEVAEWVYETPVDFDIDDKQ